MYYSILIHYFSVPHPPSPYVHFAIDKSILPFSINLIVNNTLLSDQICHPRMIKKIHFHGHAILGETHFTRKSIHIFFMDYNALYRTGKGKPLRSAKLEVY